MSKRNRKVTRIKPNAKAVEAAQRGADADTIRRAATGEPDDRDPRTR